ncbi:Fic family protein [Helicobacter bizzozeronii]|uniref:Fic family protein n=1 Tax=Helicobacter bizzozeronii TaxID=56877 RepID=UPI00244D8C47|nr:Fic family protein [Helicobacter bizzozeronii]GMB93747.1 Fic family protein [Helicobacter bizzozeronii]
MDYKQVFSNAEYLLDLTIRMAHHSTAIEGNSLTQNETASILVEGFIPKAMREREYYEVKNYQQLMPFLLESLENKTPIDNEFIKKIHAILMQNLIDNHGRFKTIQNVVLGADFETEKPYKIPMTLKDWCDNLAYQLEHSQDNNQKLAIIMDAHIKFERIHPFSDGNGRTGRSLIFYSVLEHNLTPFVITKEVKDTYMRAMRAENTQQLVQLAKEAQAVERKRIESFLEQHKHCVGQWKL